MKICYDDNNINICAKFSGGPSTGTLVLTLTVGQKPVFREQVETSSPEKQCQVGVGPLKVHLSPSLAKRLG